MRVALLCNNLRPIQGWATLTVNLGHALSALGIEVVALTARDDEPPATVPPYEVRPVLPPLTCRATALRLLAANRRVTRATADCDVVHVIAEPYALACGETTRTRPVVLTACGTYVPMTTSQGRFRKAYARAFRATRLVAISRYTAGRVERALPGVRPEVILPGVDFAAYQAAGIAPGWGTPLVVAAGGVKKRKGTQVLVRAMAEVVQAVPAARLAILGLCPSDGYVMRTRELIGELDLADHVRITGPVPFEELLGWYRAATVSVLPSISTADSFEGFGLVLLEAQAAGTPVIGARDCGNEEALVEGTTGLLVDQNDPADLAACLVQLLSDPARRNRMAAAAREFAATLDWAHVAARYQEYYRRVLAG